MENRERTKGALLSYIGFIGMAVVFGILLWKKPSWWLTYGMGLVPALVVSNLIHELCHLGAYVALGIPWKCLRFACFLLENTEEGIRLSLDGNRWIGEAACTCLYKKEIPFKKYAIALLSGGGGCAFFAIVVFLLPWGAKPWVVVSLRCFCTALLCDGLFHLLWPGCDDRKLLRAVSKERKGEKL